MLNKTFKYIDKYIYLFLIAMYIIIALSVILEKSTISEKLQILLPLIFTIAFIRYGMYCILWIQLKNPSCPRKFLNFGTWFFIMMSFLLTIYLFILFFAAHQSPMFASPLITMSAFSGSLRFKIKNQNLINEKQRQS